MNEADLTLMEWEDAAACDLAYRIHETLRGHALRTNCVERRGEKSLLVKPLTPIPLTVQVAGSRNDTTVTFCGPNGASLSREEALRVPLSKASRIDRMEDAALQAARVLRAHLATDGAAAFRLSLSFGLTSEGECLLQVINPLECQFDTADLATLAGRLAAPDRP